MQHFKTDSTDVMGLAKYLLIADNGDEAVMLEAFKTFLESTCTMKRIKLISLFKTAKYCHNCGTEQVQTEEN